MDLYYLDASPPCRSVMLLAKSLGVKLNKKQIDLFKNEQKTPEFLAMNPQHCIPTIVDGDLTLWESRAICTYLVSEYGKDDSLYPRNPKKRAEIDRLLYFDIGTLWARYGHIFFPAWLESKKPEQEVIDKFYEAVEWLDDILKKKRFCAGDSITVADYALITSVSSFITSGFTLEKYENVLAWVKRCELCMEGYDTENQKGANEFGGFARSMIFGGA